MARHGTALSQQIPCRRGIVYARTISLSLSLCLSLSLSLALARARAHASPARSREGETGVDSLLIYFLLSLRSSAFRPRRSRSRAPPSLSHSDPSSSDDGIKKLWSLLTWILDCTAQVAARNPSFSYFLYPHVSRVLQMPWMFFWNADQQRLVITWCFLLSVLIHFYKSRSLRKIKLG